MDTQLLLFEMATHFFSLNNKIEAIMATQQELAQQISAVTTELSKVNDEIQAKIQTLVDAASNAGNVSPELQAAVDALVPAAQKLDDIVPDAAPEAPAAPVSDGSNNDVPAADTTTDVEAIS